MESEIVRRLAVGCSDRLDPSDPQQTSCDEKYDRRNRNDGEKERKAKKPGRLERNKTKKQDRWHGKDPADVCEYIRLPPGWVQVPLRCWVDTVRHSLEDTKADE